VRARWPVRLATVADADEVADLLHDFNTEFGSPTPGADVLAARLSLAGGRGVDLIEINVDEGDVDARRFYERHGFSATEPGAAEHAIYYARELAS
jgi:hypothetical protein